MAAGKDQMALNSGLWPFSSIMDKLENTGLR